MCLQSVVKSVGIVVFLCVGVVCSALDRHLDVLSRGSAAMRAHGYRASRSLVATPR